MTDSKKPDLSADDVDDLLYYTRTNDETALQESLTTLAAQHSCSPGGIVTACVDAENGNTMIHFCAANGFMSLLTNLLKLFQSSGSSNSSVQAGPDVTPYTTRLVNQRNSLGNTPLHWAAYNGHLDVVKLLITAGADMWIKNEAGHLAMFEAERAEKSDVVQFLLEAGGTTVEQTGSEGQTEAESADVDDDGNVDIQMSAGDVSGPGESHQMNGL